MEYGTWKRGCTRVWLLSAPTEPPENVKDVVPAATKTEVPMQCDIEALLIQSETHHHKINSQNPKWYSL
jgi:hypothetical protein